MTKNKRSAIILCGGKGTRLGELGKKLPKTLVKVQRKEILWYIIKILKINRFDHLILPIGYKGHLIKNFLEQNKNFHIKIDCISTGINANIGSRIAQVADKIKSRNFLLLNGDAIFDIDINKIFCAQEEKKIDISFLSSEITYPYGTVGVVNGKVNDFKRNLVYDALSTRSLNNYKAYNYMGMSVINSDLIKNMKNIYKNSLNFEKIFFPKIINSHSSQLIKIKGLWHSIDNIKDLNVVNNKLNKDKKFIEIEKLKKKLLK